MIQYKIDIWTCEYKYAIYVFGQDNNNSGARTLEWTNEIPSLQKYDFKKFDDEFRNLNYDFYQENDVVECIQSLIYDIEKYVSKLKNEYLPQ